MSKFISTRNDKIEINDTFAIINGLSNDKGLYIFKDFKKFDLENFMLSKEKINFKILSKNILKMFFDSFDEKDLEIAVNKAYDVFDDEDITPTTPIGDDFLLELFHGPTLAFKDVALRMLPQLLTLSIKKENIKKIIYILCATSGDTGKAALEGFKDVKGTFITVFYPYKQVSHTQYLQMATTGGMNTNVVSVNANFDECQKIVKALMNERDNILKNKNILFSSANSINIGRLVPQIVYYIKSYLDLVFYKKINFGDKVNFSVPTGNFGDILAGYIAKNIGLPIDKLICASNKNNVLTDFFETGIYDANRNFYNTYSPSMDILISSNLERLLYLYSKDTEYINYLMDSLNKNRRFEIKKDMLNKINETFVAYYCDDNETLETINETFKDKRRVIDPHTACSTYALEKFKKEFNPNSKNIILSTASPYKFSNAILKALGENLSDDDFVNMKRLNEISNIPIPENLFNLKTLPINHRDNIDKDGYINYIKSKLDDLN